MSATHKKKILVIVGPTASGKTALSVRLAKHFDGEIISADSRQVYRGLDIGTEKTTKAEMGGVPHHLIDVVDPTQIYTAADFARDATKAIEDIHARGKLPIVVGGTIFYINALLGDELPRVPPNPELRAALEAHDTSALCTLLETQDPRRYATIDTNNRRRLIRALEVVDALGVVPEPAHERRYDALVIGIETSPAELRARIEGRLAETLAKGLVEETRTLLARGITSERLNEIGLEYRVVIDYLDGSISKERLPTVLGQKVWQYAKRQRTWLKRLNDAIWVSRDDEETIRRTISTFLAKD